MAVKQLFPTPPQWVDANGDPYSGALLFFYAAGSSTKQDAYTDSSGGTACSNPTTLNSSGYPANSGNIFTPFGTVGQTYKLGLAAPGSSDPPASFIWTADNIVPTNDVSSGAVTQWVSGPTPTYISATSFSLVGDQTTEFHVGRRVKTTNSGGTIYSTIVTSAYAAVTTVTVVNDTGTLDAGLSAVSYGLLSATNPSTPLLADTFPVVSGSSDKTKKLRFEVDGFTTATTRVLTPPDADLTLAAVTAAGDILQASASGVLARLAIGTVGQRATSTGSLVAWVTGIDRQTFTGNGTWTKPSNFSPSSMAYIQAWGGGGSGGKGAANAPEGGGGGGGYNERWVLLSAMGATETITIGAGGAAQTSGSTAGNAGGDTTVGSLLTAYGGGGGGANATGGGGGGGGGTLGAGASGSGQTGGIGGQPAIRTAVVDLELQGSGANGATAAAIWNGGPNNFGGGGGGAGNATNKGKGGNSHWGGGGGGGGFDGVGDGTNSGGGSVWGGGGGGGAANSTAGGTAGSSVYGGAGSAGAIDANNSSAGTQPGGGSGGTEGGDSGAGGSGQVIITVIG